MTYEESKREFQKEISKFPNSSLEIKEAMQRWKAIAILPFAGQKHAVNGLAVFPYLSGDDPDDYDEPWTVSLLPPDEIDRRWNERETEYLGGSKCFLIGWLDGNGHDDPIFISTNLLKGVAIQHEDDVFSSKDLNALVWENIENLSLNTIRFVELLREL